MDRPGRVLGEVELQDLRELCKLMDEYGVSLLRLGTVELHRPRPPAQWSVPDTWLGGSEPVKDEPNSARDLSVYEDPDLYPTGVVPRIEDD